MKNWGEVFTLITAYLQTKFPDVQIYNTTYWPNIKAISVESSIKDTFLKLSFTPNGDELSIAGDMQVFANCRPAGVVYVYGKLKYVEISHPNFNPETYFIELYKIIYYLITKCADQITFCANSAKEFLKLLEE